MAGSNSLPSELNAPKQEVHEQPNGQFQITENGALNLMKAESMDMLVVNKLAQDLSVGREQNCSTEKQNELTEASPVTGPLSEMYKCHQEQQQGSMGGAVGCCLPLNSTPMATTETLPASFLSSLIQTSTGGVPYIDNPNTKVFTMPEVEVLTTELPSLREKPCSPEALMVTPYSQSSPEQPAPGYLMEVLCFHIVSMANIH